MTSAHHCQGCGARVILARTQAGKTQPLDWTPNHEGNVAAYQDALGTWRARTLGKKAAPARAPEHVYMPHFATCTARPKPEPRPQATVTELDEWRQRTISTSTPAKRRRSGRR